MQRDFVQHRIEMQRANRSQETVIAGAEIVTASGDTRFKPWPGGDGIGGEQIREDWLLKHASPVAHVAIGDDEHARKNGGGCVATNQRRDGSSDFGNGLLVRATRK